MTYINEPGLEGTSLLNPDLRVDFLNQAQDYLNFGYALNSDSENGNTWTEFWVYDANDVQLAYALQNGAYTFPDGTNPSSFPEGYITTTFTGIASYALFDFSSDQGRYILDNFEGKFGSTEVPAAEPIPEPATMLLLGSGLIGLAGIRRKFKK